MNATENQAWSAWRPAAWLRVTGTDAFTFLQGQFTNDLRVLAAEAPSVYGLWLNHKGRVTADSFVLRGAGPEEFRVGSYFSPATTIRDRLEAFIIADDVTVVDETEQWSGATLPTAAIETARAAGGHLFPARRGACFAQEWIFPCEQEAAVAELLAKFPRITAGELERRRIEARIPAVPADLGPGELPNEGGLERDAISYTKGCYLGQEVMARLKSMGQVRRRLLAVQGEGGPPATPAPLFQGARSVGELRSVASVENGYIGLALLTLLRLDAASGLSLAADGPATLALVEIP